MVRLKSGRWGIPTPNLKFRKFLLYALELIGLCHYRLTEQLINLVGQFI